MGLGGVGLGGGTGGVGGVGRGLGTLVLVSMTSFIRVARIDVLIRYSVILLSHRLNNHRHHRGGGWAALRHISPFSPKQI